MSDSDVAAKATAYLAEVKERMAKVSYCDRRGEPLGAIRPAEERALAAAVEQYAATAKAGKPARVVLELEEEARKEVVLFLGLLPLVQADAARFPHVLYLAADGEAESRAKLSFVRLPVLEPRVEFETWDAVVARPENGFKQPDIAACWVLGDVDWSAAPIPGRSLDERQRGLARVLSGGQLPVILVHQKGKATLGSWPPSVAAGGCFIATAACGSAGAAEVSALRAWRDRVLLPSRAGAAVVAAYGLLSPPLARWLTPRPRARRLVRALVVRPLARWTRQAEKSTHP